MASTDDKIFTHRDRRYWGLVIRGLPTAWSVDVALPLSGNYGTA